VSYSLTAVKANFYEAIHTYKHYIGQCLSDQTFGQEYMLPSA